MEDTNFHHDRHLYAVRPLPGRQVIRVLSLWDGCLVFQAKRLARGDEMLHTNSVDWIAGLYTCSVEESTGGGAVRRAFILLVSETVSATWTRRKGLSSCKHGSLPVTVYEKLGLLSRTAIITTSGSERWCYRLRVFKAEFKESGMTECVGVGECMPINYSRNCQTMSHGPNLAHCFLNKALLDISTPVCLHLWLLSPHWERWVIATVWLA